MSNQANVVPMQQPQPQSSAKFTIRCHFDGFDVVVECEGKADNLKLMIDRLKSIGAQPIASLPQASAAVAGAHPVCPIHHKPMKASRKPGAWFCAQKRDDGEYCQEKA